jgi:hypothetical protein
MRIVGYRQFCAAGIAALFYFAPSPTLAAGLDGTSNLMCAAINVVACVDSGNCRQGQAKHFDLPEFLLLDAQQQVVRGTDVSGVKEVSPVKNMETSGNQLILQGVEEGHGWVMSIHMESGDMSATVTGEEVSFIVFGACAPI